MKNEFFGIGPADEGIPSTLALNGGEDVLALLFEKRSSDFGESQFRRGDGQVFCGSDEDWAVWFCNEKFQDDGAVEIHD